MNIAEAAVIAHTECLSLQVAAKCFELDRKPLMEPMLNLWISVVTLAGCAAGSFKADFEMGVNNGETLHVEILFLQFIAVTAAICQRVGHFVCLSCCQ